MSESAPDTFDEAKQTSDSEQEQEPDDPDINYRFLSILSYFVVLVIIGFPVWWYTTRVYRASLPLNKIYDAQLQNQINEEFGIPLSLEYDILISIVNPDPGSLEIELNGEDLDQNLQPFLKTISVADFVVKSQWLFLTELGTIPRRKGDHYALEEKQLPHIITPLETKLWTHLSTRPTINLVVYFPHCTAPLYIYNNKNEILKSNAFLSPRWGGISIINADKASCQNKLFKPNLQLIVSSFTSQLQKLFKMNGLKKNDIYELKMRKAKKMVDSTRRTLKSLAQLLSEISSIVISDEVGEKVNIAVENSELADHFLNEGDVDQGLQHAKIAFSNSEEAFSDPSLLALLYFPEDQKYAVYIPLFLPIMIPVFMSLTFFKKWRAHYQLAKEKLD